MLDFPDVIKIKSETVPKNAECSLLTALVDVFGRRCNKIVILNFRLTSARHLYSPLYTVPHIIMTAYEADRVMSILQMRN